MVRRVIFRMVSPDYLAALYFAALGACSQIY
jgi:hypothetical protein